MRRRPFKVIVCLITVWSFVFTTICADLSWADKVASGLSPDSSEKPVSPGVVKGLNVNTFSIPEYLGHVRSSWLSPKRTTNHVPRTTIIHIQDAHCNYAAQQQIAKIIKHVNKEYGVDTINLEGGAKDYDLSAFTSIPDKTVREKTADYFVKEGLVNGAEYFAINNPDKVSLWGIEDPDLYIENLNIYRNSLKHKDEVDKSLKSLSYILSSLKIKLYSKELLEFDHKYSQYKAGNIEFKEYLNYLLSMAAGKAVDIAHYRNISLLDRALQEESDINFKKADIERDELIDIMRKYLSRNSMEELVLKTVDFKAEKISQKDFYAYLMNNAVKLRIDLSNMGELRKYIDYITLYADVDKMKVSEEIDDLEGKLKNLMCENDTQRELAALSKNFAILKNIFNITLTRDDYRYYKKNEDAFAMRTFTRFIEQYAPIALDSSLRGGEAAEAISSLDQYRADISRFYEYSFKRDVAFLRNITFTNNERRTTNDRPIISVLITGGFHTDNLCELFRKNGISYISIMPNFKNVDGYKSRYFSLLGGELPGVGKLIYDAMRQAKMSTMAIADPWTKLAQDVWGEASINAIRYYVAMIKIIFAKEMIKNDFGSDQVTGITVDEKGFHISFQGQPEIITIDFNQLNAGTDNDLTKDRYIDLLKQKAEYIKAVSDSGASTATGVAASIGMPAPLSAAVAPSAAKPGSSVEPQVNARTEPSAEAPSKGINIDLTRRVFGWVAITVLWVVVFLIVSAQSLGAREMKFSRPTPPPSSHIQIVPLPRTDRQITKDSLRRFLSDPFFPYGEKEAFEIVQDGDYPDKEGKSIAAKIRALEKYINMVKALDYDNRDRRRIINETFTFLDDLNMSLKKYGFVITVENVDLDGSGSGALCLLSYEIIKELEADVSGRMVYGLFAKPIHSLEKYSSTGAIRMPKSDLLVINVTKCEKHFEGVYPYLDLRRDLSSMDIPALRGVTDNVSRKALLKNAFFRNVFVHELRHRVDMMFTDHLVFRLGNRNITDEDQQLCYRVNDELSAYLAQIGLGGIPYITMDESRQSAGGGLIFGSKLQRYSAQLANLMALDLISLQAARQGIIPENRTIRYQIFGRVVKEPTSEDEKFKFPIKILSAIRTRQVDIQRVVNGFCSTFINAKLNPIDVQIICSRAYKKYFGADMEMGSHYTSEDLKQSQGEAGYGFPGMRGTTISRLNRAIEKAARGAVNSITSPFSGDEGVDTPPSGSPTHAPTIENETLLTAQSVVRREVVKVLNELAGKFDKGSVSVSVNKICGVLKNAEFWQKNSSLKDDRSAMEAATLYVRHHNAIIAGLDDGNVYETSRILKEIVKSIERENGVVTKGTIEVFGVKCDILGSSILLTKSGIEVLFVEPREDLRIWGCWSPRSEKILVVSSNINLFINSYLLRAAKEKPIEIWDKWPGGSPHAERLNAAAASLILSTYKDMRYVGGEKLIEDLKTSVIKHEEEHALSGYVILPAPMIKEKVSGALKRFGMHPMSIGMLSIDVAEEVDARLVELAGDAPQLSLIGMLRALQRTSEINSRFYMSVAIILEGLCGVELYNGLTAEGEEAGKELNIISDYLEKLAKMDRSEATRTLNDAARRIRSAYNLPVQLVKASFLLEKKGDGFVFTPAAHLVLPMSREIGRAMFGWLGPGAETYLTGMLVAPVMEAPLFLAPTRFLALHADNTALNIGSRKIGMAVIYSGMALAVNLAARLFWQDPNLAIIMAGYAVISNILLHSAWNYMSIAFPGLKLSELVTGKPGKITDSAQKAIKGDGSVSAPAATDIAAPAAGVKADEKPAATSVEDIPYEIYEAAMKAHERELEKIAEDSSRLYFYTPSGIDVNDPAIKLLRKQMMAILHMKGLANVGQISRSANSISMEVRGAGSIDLENVINGLIEKVGKIKKSKLLAQFGEGWDIGITKAKELDPPVPEGTPEGLRHRIYATTGNVSFILSESDDCTVIGVLRSGVLMFALTIVRRAGKVGAKGKAEYAITGPAAKQGAGVSDAEKRNIELAAKANTAMANVQRGNRNYIIGPATAENWAQKFSVDQRMSRLYREYDGGNTTAKYYNYDGAEAGDAEKFKESIKEMLGDLESEMTREEQLRPGFDPRAVIYAPDRQFKKDGKDVGSGYDIVNEVLNEDKFKKIKKYVSILRGNIPDNGIVEEAQLMDLGVEWLDYIRREDEYHAHPEMLQRLVEHIKSFIDDNDFKDKNDIVILRDIKEGTISLSRIAPVEWEKWKDIQDGYIKLRTAA